MNNNENKLINSQQQIDEKKKRIMMNIKELQRDLIKASFKQSSAPKAYAELLHAISEERDKIKQLNQVTT